MEHPSPDNVILGLLAIHPCHGYQLLDYFHDPQGLGRVWQMSTSQLYVVLKRLQQQGFITGHAVESPDAPTRTEYHLTEAGQDSLMIWLHERQPSASVRYIRVEFLSRLHLARMLGVSTLPIVSAQKAVCQLQLKLLYAQRETAAPGIGFWALEFMIAQLEAVLQWIDRCELVPHQVEGREGP
jgi:DNA-binding PadR family transcriptional regulator